MRSNREVRRLGPQGVAAVPPQACVLPESPMTKVITAKWTSAIDISARKLVLAGGPCQARPLAGREKAWNQQRKQVCPPWICETGKLAQRSAIGEMLPS